MLNLFKSLTLFQLIFSFITFVMLSLQPLQAQDIIDNKDTHNTHNTDTLLADAIFKKDLFNDWASVGSAVSFAPATGTFEPSPATATFTPSANIGKIELIKDINTRPDRRSLCSQPVKMNGVIYFCGQSADKGKELWKSDGTEAGTVLVKDINDGQLSSSPGSFLVANNILYFSAVKKGLGFELWKTDGTEAGTVLIKDIREGIRPSNPSNMTNVNGTIFFTASNNFGSELWKTDGTEAGTILVKDINREAYFETDPDVSNQGSEPSGLININGTLFFSATSEHLKNGIWKSDGTEAGTVLVKNMTTGVFPSARPYALTNVNDTLYFSVSMNHLPNKKTLWKSDGTEAGTVRVKDDLNQEHISSLVSIDDTLYFRSNGLWKSDGTQAGTSLIKELEISSITVIDRTLYFFSVAHNNHQTEYKLWKSDGTEAGTVLIKDIDSKLYFGNLELVNSNGTLFFNTIKKNSTSRQLWKSDGTEAGTVLVKEFESPISTLYLIQDNVVSLINLNGSLLFRAYTEENGYALWKTDGSEAGTVLVKDIMSSTKGSNPSHLASTNDTLYFSSSTKSLGQELWKTDGTEAGTVLVKDIQSGSESSSPSSLLNVNDIVYFQADSDATGKELWKSDGSEAGTVLVKDIYSGSEDSDPSPYASLNGVLYFTALSDSTDFKRKLWKTDGTEAGTKLVKDSEQHSFQSSGAVNFNNTLFFDGNDDIAGSELWKTDGTEAGTILVKDIQSGASSSKPLSLTRVNNILFFTANDGVNGRALWKTDGTAAGTVLIKNINNDNNSSKLTNLTEVNGTLFFTAITPETGEELWKSDGTEAGTVLVKDITVGHQSSYPTNLTDVNGTLYFRVDKKLWKSDGTEAGTRPVEYFNTGITIDHSSKFINFNGVLYLTAKDPAFGNELRKLIPAGFTITKNTNANGIQNSLSVVLTSAPVNDITMTVASSNSNIIASPGNLVFTSNNWNIPHTITLSKLENTPADGSLISIITMSVKHADVNLNTDMTVQVDLTANNNHAPTITGSPVTTIAHDTAYSFTPVASDADSDSLHFTVTGLPAWASLDITTGTITGTPTTNDIGTSSPITISVSDAKSTVSLPEFAITVTVANQAPTDIQLSNTLLNSEATPATPFATLSTTDADSSDTHSYSLIRSFADNHKFSISSNQLTINETPDFNKQASYSIRIKTIDNNGLSFEKSFAITVKKGESLPPAKPVILTTTTVANGMLKITGTAPAGLSIEISFPDNTIVTSTANVDGHYSVTSLTPQTTGTIHARVFDTEGNYSEVLKLVFTDTTAPEPSTIPVLITPNSDGSYQLSGFAEPGSTVTISFRDGSKVSTKVDVDGTYSVTSSKNQTFSNASITITDGAGNISEPTNLIGEIIATEDTDGDGIPNLKELGDNDYRNPKDTDADGIPDYLESNSRDTDDDGISDFKDSDDDGDGIPTLQEGAGDADHDGIPDYLDADNGTDGTGGDSDGDGISDMAECQGSAYCVDTDNDNIPDYMDPDSDNDDISDKDELGDDSNNPLDIDGDTLPDYLESNTDDLDGDGIVNANDSDDDGDGTDTSTEIGKDEDHDSIPDYMDVDDDESTDNDSDNDGISDNEECQTRCIDTDGDGVADYMDSDSDGDGISDKKEYANSSEKDIDTDSDGIPDYRENNLLDTDGDGLYDFEDNDDDGDGTLTINEIIIEDDKPLDTDHDGIPDYLDLDTNAATPEGDAKGDADQDGIPDSIEYSKERGLAPDSDKDSRPNYRDIDDDNDGIFSKEEGGSIDTDGDGIPNYLENNHYDTDKDNIPDYKDTDDDGDGIPTREEIGNDPLLPNAKYLTNATTTDPEKDTDSNGGGGSFNPYMIMLLLLTGLFRITRKKV